MTIQTDLDQYVKARNRVPGDDARLNEDAADEVSLPPVAWWHRYAPAHLTSRILIINLFGLVILVLGILFFSESRKSLIDARVQSLMTQAQIMAAAVGSAVATDSDQLIIDPERLIEQQLNPAAAGAANQGRTDFLIDPDRAGPVLRRLVQNTDIRAHLFDKDGAMIVDSRYFYGRGEVLRINLPPLQGKVDQPLIDQFWTSSTNGSLPSVTMSRRSMRPTMAPTSKKSGQRSMVRPFRLSGSTRRRKSSSLWLCRCSASARCKVRWC
jgi:hypothetical protein